MRTISLISILLLGQPIPVKKEVALNSQIFTSYERYGQVSFFEDRYDNVVIQGVKYRHAILSTEPGYVVVYNDDGMEHPVKRWAIRVNLEEEKQ